MSKFILVRLLGSQVRNPLEASIDELLLHSWGNDSVSGQSVDEGCSGVLLCKIKSFGVNDVEIVSHSFSDSGEESIVVVIVKGKQAVCNLGV